MIKGEVILVVKNYFCKTKEIFYENFCLFARPLVSNFSENRNFPKKLSAPEKMAKLSGGKVVQDKDNGKVPWGGVRIPIVSVGQNQKPPFLKRDSLADTLIFFTKKLFFRREKKCLPR